MKIAHLLAQYLYEQKRLTLTGIGHFELDAAIFPEPSKGKNSKPAELPGVHFQYDPQAAEDPELIAFISAQSGKIKALATADLDSHLELGRQFLNIGKPFWLEGIGHLSKTGTGEYSFHAGAILTEKADPHSNPNSFREERLEENGEDYRGILYTRKEKKGIPRPLAVVLILAGIGLAVWGGYLIYQNMAHNQPDPGVNTEATKKEPVPEATPPRPDTAMSVLADSSRTASLQDSSRAAVVAPPPAPSGSYRFVLEESSRERALTRFSRLKSYGWKVQMETRDSLQFTLFMDLSLNPSDTARVRDSLSRLNGKPVRMVK